MVAALGRSASHYPFDKSLADLVGELSIRSVPFRSLWGAHDLRPLGSHVRIRHPTIGVLDLAYDTFQLAPDTGATLVTYTAEPGTQSEDALRFLSSWCNAPPDLVDPL